MPMPGPRETLPLIKEPAVVLHTPTQPVGTHLDDPEVRRLIAQMLATTQALSVLPRGCAGLAANQVGSLWRVAIVNNAPNTGLLEPLVLVDPEVLRPRQPHRVREGCLSVDDPIELWVTRYKMVGLRWRDPNGRQHSMRTAAGYLGQIIQHEVDHLDGVLCTERRARSHRCVQ